MIKENFLNIKIGYYNIEFYKYLGYNCNYKDIINIPIELVNKKSKITITGICENCYCEKKMPLRNYYKCINTGNPKKYFCKKCCYIKNKNTSLEKYGTEHPMQNIQIKEKVKNTCNKKYGVSNVSKIDKIKNDKIKTSLLHYNTLHPAQSDFIKNKRKKTCLKKYGVEHEMQNQEYFEKWLHKTFKTKTYKDTELFYQSKNELNFLESFYNKFIIKNGLSFEYMNYDKIHKYFSDFYLPEFNLIIEIKSTYIFNKNKSINLLKKECVLKNNYNFIFIIDNNYDEFIKIIQLGVQRI